jgi:hypothetical protein
LPPRELHFAGIRHVRCLCSSHNSAAQQPSHYGDIVIPHSDPARDQTLNAVIARAESDSVFRRQLLTDPRRAIFDAFGVTIPGEFRIKFIEKDADVDALIVLPDSRPVGTDGAVSDSDLEVVSGGATAHHHARLAWKGSVA